MKHWSVTLYGIAVLVLLLSIAWYIWQPDFEPLIAILVAILTLGSLLFNDTNLSDRSKAFLLGICSTSVLIAIFILFQFRPINLTGLWIAEGYTCGSFSTPQEVRIEHTGNSVIATKITGDPCIGPGDKSWEGKWTSNWTDSSKGSKFPIDFYYFSELGKRESEKGTAIIESRNKLTIWYKGSDTLITMRRK